MHFGPTCPDFVLPTPGAKSYTIFNPTGRSGGQCIQRKLVDNCYLVGVRGRKNVGWDRQLHNEAEGTCSRKMIYLMRFRLRHSVGRSVA